MRTLETLLTLLLYALLIAGTWAAAYVATTLLLDGVTQKRS